MRTTPLTECLQGVGVEENIGPGAWRSSNRYLKKHIESDHKKLQLVWSRLGRFQEFMKFFNDIVNDF